ncbi:HAD family hydrolase [Paenibacillus vini]|uniref:Haloacid dehalogenase n=1 Tax=Paenibacillus vini TaxID=1476024 RepID=A0ABQ4MIS9_9BACL|nr:hypothetical protein [Paenibacillus vini]GIP55877.1 hypothetical protein J42TS3_49120 [Paenibacillus vini]
MLKRIKEKLFYYVAEKNPHILREYQQYRWNNEELHRKNRLKSWSLLVRLNWKYRNFKKNNSSNTVQIKGPRVPYLKGPESSVYKRATPHHFAKDLLQYDIVSFDIFDTLVLRPFTKPVDLFMIVGQKLNYNGFYSLRIEAERAVRAISDDNEGTREITIEEIYKYIEKNTGIPKEQGIKAEFETEIDFCFANPYMKRVFDILQSHKKRMIIVSDMYYPKNMMNKLLEECGYTGYENIFVSCDYKISKSRKDLYNVVRNEFGDDLRIVHIGDNIHADINNAKEMGFETRYYKNVHEIGNQYRADGMSELIGSGYSGVVNTHLHNGTKEFSPAYEYGFIYGGLYIAGFCNWIHSYSKVNNIDKVIFLARDGDIYKKVYDELFDDIPSEYLLWSRIAHMKYLLQKDRNIFLKRNIDYRISSKQDITISSILTSIGLSQLSNKLIYWNLNREDKITQENADHLKKFFIDNIDEIIAIYKKGSDLAKEYVHSLIGEAKKVAIVDVGWNGTGPLGLKVLIEEEWNLSCEVSCLLAASGGPPTDIIANIQTEKIESYIFSRSNNRNLYDTHFSTNKGANSAIFELFTQAKSPSFSGFNNSELDFEFTFDLAEVENYSKIEEIHQGIIDFVKSYFTTFNKYPYMFNIAGYDAYLPFRMIIRDLSYIKNFFSDFVFNLNTGGDLEKKNVDTLGETLRKRML